MLSVKFAYFSSRSSQLGRGTYTRHGIKLGYSSLTECSLTRMEGADTGIAVLQMNRPEAKNAISRNFLAQFRDCLKQASTDRAVRVFILSSAVPGAFCAGADLKERGTMSKPEVSDFVTSLRSTFSDLSKLRIPTIAAINGAALGGGLELALSCDLRVAGNGAKIGLTETKLAIIPGAGGTQRLPRLIGASKAKELIFSARILNHKEAAAYGIVNYAVDGDALDKALELAREILPNGPVALEMAKKAIDMGIAKELSAGMEIEEACYAQIIPTKDRLEGLAAFKEKRKSQYTGE